MRRLPDLVAILLLVLSTALTGPALAADEPLESTTTAQPRTSLADLEDEVMCIVCGTLLGLSESPAAERQRAMIQRLIDQGKSKEEIKDALVAEFGPNVLALPENSGFNISAYLVPVLGLLLAAVALFLALRRWRRDTAGEGGTETASGARDDSLPGDPASDGLSAEESRRLDDDLARYDL